VFRAEEGQKKKTSPLIFFFALPEPEHPERPEHLATSPHRRHRDPHLPNPLPRAEGGLFRRPDALHRRTSVSARLDSLLRGGNPPIADEELDINEPGSEARLPRGAVDRLVVNAPAVIHPAVGAMRGVMAVAAEWRGLSADCRRHVNTPRAAEWWWRTDPPP
jgi:hypothetical protein